MADLEEFTVEAFDERAHVPAGAKLDLLRIPNYVHMEHREWDAEAFEALKAQEREEREEEARRRGTAAKDTENPLMERGAIRWRRRAAATQQRPATDGEGNGGGGDGGEGEGVAGVEEMESNARLVRWSDGSMQLLVGSKYVYDVEPQTIAGASTYLYSNMNAGSGLLCQGKLQQRLRLLPSSPAAKLQQKIELAISNTKSGKQEKAVKMYLTDQNPHLVREEMEKEEQKRSREHTRRRKQVERTLSGYSNDVDATRRFIQEEDYEEEEEEDEEDEEDDPGSALARFQLERKRKRKEEEEREQRILDAKNAAMAPSSARSSAADDDSDVDMDAPAAKPRSRVIEEDSDDEE